MDKLLAEFVRRMQAAYGDDLLRVMLYGSAASGDYHEKFSDLNLLCVLRAIGAPALRAGRETIAWWAAQGQPTPLLLSEEEMLNATDVFPIEMLDIKQCHRVLHGSGLLDVEINMRHHRRQLEHELRSTVLRLRARYLLAQTDEAAVLELMARSIATVATLARHALIAAGQGGVENGGRSPLAAPMQKEEALRSAARRFHLSEQPFATILQIRKDALQLSGEPVHSLFASYLEQVTRLAQAVDQL